MRVLSLEFFESCGDKLPHALCVDGVALGHLSVKRMRWCGPGEEEQGNVGQSYLSLSAGFRVKEVLDAG